MKRYEALHDQIVFLGREKIELAELLTSLGSAMGELERRGMVS